MTVDGNDKLKQLQPVQERNQKPERAGEKQQRKEKRNRNPTFEMKDTVHARCQAS